jgi:hypothetical protein
LRCRTVVDEDSRVGADDSAFPSRDSGTDGTAAVPKTNAFKKSKKEYKNAKREARMPVGAKDEAKAELDPPPSGRTISVALGTKSSSFIVLLPSSILFQCENTKKEL